VRQATALVGVPLFRASSADARAALLGISAVLDARVELGLPASARVVLTEREAVGRWVAGTLEWFVDAGGVLFASSDATAAPALRVHDDRTAGRAAGERLDPALVAAALRLAKIAPGELRADASDPRVRVRPGPDGIVLETGGGWEVRFGGPEGIEEKLVLLARFLRDHPGRRLEYVDVRSTDRIVFSPE
ncbi:MAG: cell division protein FtsQ/DivIB, partial [Candidatus Limnocylindria bacterium]